MRSDGAGMEMRSVGNQQQPAMDNFDSLLSTLGLDDLCETLAAAQLEFEDLHSLAQHDAACCTNELEKAGVRVPGHRVKIVAALLNMNK